MPPPASKGRLLIKIAVGLALGGLAAAGAANWVLKTYLPPERVRELVLREAGKVLHREMRLGEISLGALRGLVIEKLEISELPDFKAGTFLSAEAFQIKIKVLPLISRQIEIDRVALEGLKVSITRDARGRFNFSDLMETSTAPVHVTPGGAAAAALPVALRVGRAAVLGAEISLRDSEFGPWRVSDADIEVEDFDLGRSFGAKAKLAVHGKWGPRPIDAQLKFDGRIDPANLELAAAGIEFEELEASLAGVRVKGSGSLSTPAAPSLKFKGKVWHKDAEVLDLNVSSATVSSFQGEGGLPEFFVDFRAESRGFSTTGLEFFGVPGGKDVPAGETGGQISFRGGNLEMENFRVNAKDLQAEASGSILRALSGKPEARVAATFKADLPAIEASKIPMRPKEIPGNFIIPAVKAEGKVRLEGDSADVKAFSLHTQYGDVTLSGSVKKMGSQSPEIDLSASFKVDLPAIAARDIPMRPKEIPANWVLPPVKAEGSIQVKGDSAEIQTLSLKTKFGDAKLSGSVRKIKSTAPDLDLTAVFHGDTPELKAADFPFPGLPAWLVLPAAKSQGTVRMKGDTGTLEGVGVKSKFGNLTVTGEVRKLTSGKPIPNLSVSVNGETPAMKSSEIPVPGLPPGLDIPAFKLNGNARIGADDLGLEAFKIACSYGTAEISGKVKKLTSGKPEPDLAMTVNGDVPEIKAADLPMKNIPAGLTIPPGHVYGKLSIGADEVSFDGFSLKNKFGTMKLTGKVLKIMTGPPDPRLDMTADLNLPAFKTSDIPWEGLPKDWSFPASKWNAAFSGDLDHLQIRSVEALSGVEGAQNKIKVEGRIQNLGLKDPSKFDADKIGFDLTKVQVRFYLDQITPITPETRGLKMKGKVLFGGAVKGNLDKQPFVGFSQFDGLAVSLYGFDLSDFTGKATLNDKGLKLPNLNIPRIKGSLDGAPMEIDFTVSDFLAAPKLDVDITLASLDLDKLLEAKAAFFGGGGGGGSAAPGGGETSSAVKNPALDAKRSLIIKRIFHPNAEINDLEARWDLSDITTDLKKISGEAKFRIGVGRFDDLPKVVRREAALKAMALPFMLISKILKLGKIQFSEAAGLYRFKDGLMTIEDMHITTNKGDYFVSGSINLPDETLDIRMRSERLFPPVAAVVTGTFENPKTKAGIAVK